MAYVNDLFTKLFFKINLNNLFTSKTYKAYNRRNKLFVEAANLMKQGFKYNDSSDGSTSGESLADANDIAEIIKVVATQSLSIVQTQQNERSNSVIDSDSTKELLIDKRIIIQTKTIMLAQIGKKLRYFS